MNMLNTQMAGGPALPAPTVMVGGQRTGATAEWLRAEDGGRATTAAAVIDLLRRQQEMIATLLAWQVSLLRPRTPEDYGLDLAGENPTHRRLAAALLPPGTAVHRDDLVRTVYREHLAEGWAIEDAANILRTAIGRLRLVVAEHGWDIPCASSTSDYVLLAPGMTLPAGYGITARSRGTRRTVQPERALHAWRLLVAGERSRTVAATIGLSDVTVSELKRGRHWAQRDGLVPGWQIGVKRA